MKKLILLTLTILTLFVCSFGFKSFAEAPVEAENVSISSHSADGEQKNAPVSELMLDYVRSYTSEIFCSLTFIGSLITAFLYKKGLLPTLSEGINRIYAAAIKSGENATALQKKSEERLESFLNTTLPLLEKAGELTEYAETMRQNSIAMKDELQREKAEREALSQVLSGQTELLYGVFMSANIPEFQKEQLAERYNRIQAVIKSSASGGGNESE
ncbi:MAG: hypothetical protein E7587_00365 [Ruminococcaceae bacterium]|nr:hypothetical protein [Oscillospiraceae bacterium]